MMLYINISMVCVQIIKCVMIAHNLIVVSIHGACLNIEGEYSTMMTSIVLLIDVFSLHLHQ